MLKKSDYKKMPRKNQKNNFRMNDKKGPRIKNDSEFLKKFLLK